MNSKRVRYESFGGIVRLEDPPLTIYVDQDYMKNLGYPESELWSSSSTHLSAPIDAHFALTNKCPLECKHCYKSSTKNNQEEMTLTQIKEVIDVLAKLQVFSIAFGGGEPFAREELFEIVEYTRMKGIVPNITTNGYYITSEAIAKKCKIFGHMHISLDALGEDFNELKNVGAFEVADNAINLLNQQDIDLGINCLITRNTFEKLEELTKYCISKNIRDISFLRFKPIGRADKNYHDMRLTNDQYIKLIPLLRKLKRKYRINIQVDCSLTPMACYHKLNPKLLDFFGAQGCEGGNTFLEIREDGKVRSCSFSNYYGDNASQLDKIWDNSQYFSKYRNVLESIKEPCASCKYLKICRGGCHVISEYLTGKFNDPDPECPFVVRYKQNNRE